MKTLKIKKSITSNNACRIDAPFYLSKGVISRNKIQQCPYSLSVLDDVTEKVFFGNIFKRTFVSNSERGIPYLTGSDMIKSDIDTGRFLSKKMTKKQSSLMIKRDWILLSCSGTIGNVVYTNEIFDGRIGTHDLIRIIPNSKKIEKGFLYAFLASRYGYNLLTQSNYGGVVKHIEPKQIQNLPIPIFPEPKQQEIHKLIVDATDLRVEANRLLEEAVQLFEDKLPAIKFKSKYKAKLNVLKKNNYRLDASSHTQKITNLYIKFGKIYELKTIRELSKTVFTPNIFKRVRVDNLKMGIPFLSGSDLISQQPIFESFLSKKMKNIDNYVLRAGWIAIQDAGTIGYVSLINEYLDGVTATNNLVRIIPNETNNNYYIYGFLKTKIGQTILKSNAFGSVQKHIDNNQISDMKIPIITSIYDVVSESIEKMLQNLSDACFMENQAIQLIENEIDSWHN